MLPSVQMQAGSVQPHQRSTRPLNSTIMMVAATDLCKAKCTHVEEHIQEVLLEKTWLHAHLRNTGIDVALEPAT